ncbi:MAG: 30S ribosomal protein S17 [Candidatus Omnitrophota bacterium]|nr:30S ribosomal protein S17 [Candidatus Omnitrophota bacterium]
MELRRGKRKFRLGIVVSDKMNKTRVVRVVRLSRHPKYSRIIKSYIKFKVHDEKNTSKTGDRVRVMETRPLSKEKHWTLVEVLGQSSKG